MLSLVIRASGRFDDTRTIEDNLFKLTDPHNDRFQHGKVGLVVGVEVERDNEFEQDVFLVSQKLKIIMSKEALKIFDKNFSNGSKLPIKV